MAEIQTIEKGFCNQEMSITNESSYINLKTNIVLRKLRWLSLKANVFSKHPILIRKYENEYTLLAVADPGFPIGGGANLRRIHFSAKRMWKWKKLILLGGHAPRRPPWIRQWLGTNFNTPRHLSQLDRVMISILIYKKSVTPRIFQKILKLGQLLSI